MNMKQKLCTNSFADPLCKIEKENLINKQHVNKIYEKG